MTDGESAHLKFGDSPMFGDSDTGDTEPTSSQRWLTTEATGDISLFGLDGEYLPLFDPGAYENNAPSFSQSFRDKYFARGKDKFLQMLGQKKREELVDLSRQWSNPFEIINTTYYSHKVLESAQYDILTYALLRFKVGLLSIVFDQDAALIHLEAINEEGKRLRETRWPRLDDTAPDIGRMTALESGSVPLLSTLLAEYGLLKCGTSYPSEKSERKKLYSDQNIAARKYYGVESDATTAKESREVQDKDGNITYRARDIWCPIVQRYGSNRKMAHLLRRELSKHVVHGVFGLDPEVDLLYQRRMVLFVQSDIEEFYDAGRLTFIPSKHASQQEQSRFEMELYIVDGSLRNAPLPRKLSDEFAKLHEGSMDEPPKKWGDLHRDGYRRQLVFKNDNRPSRRVLFIHHILCEERFRIKEWKTMTGSGVSALREDLFGCDSRVAKVTPGAFPPNSIVGGWARERGLLLEKMLLGSSSNPLSPLSRPHPEMVIKQINNAIRQEAEQESAKDEGYLSDEEAAVPGAQTQQFDW